MILTKHYMNMETVQWKKLIENGEVVIFKKCREAEEAGYDHGTLSHMANGGYQKQTHVKRGYTVRKKHKDIIKAEFIINDQEE